MDIISFIMTGSALLPPNISICQDNNYLCFAARCDNSVIPDYIPQHRLINNSYYFR